MIRLVFLGGHSGCCLENGPQRPEGTGDRGPVDISGPGQRGRGLPSEGRASEETLPTAQDGGSTPVPGRESRTTSGPAAHGEIDEPTGKKGRWPSRLPPSPSPLPGDPLGAVCPQRGHILLGSPPPGSARAPGVGGVVRTGESSWSKTFSSPASGSS